MTRCRGKRRATPNSMSLKTSEGREEKADQQAFKDSIEWTTHRRKSRLYISNISGNRQCRGMVVFQGGKPDKSSSPLKIKSVDRTEWLCQQVEMIFRRIERGIKGTEWGKVTLRKSEALLWSSKFCIDGGKLIQHVDEVRRCTDVPGRVHIEVCGMVKGRSPQIRGIIYKDEEYLWKTNTVVCNLPTY